MEQLKNKYKFPSKIRNINEGEIDRVILDIGLDRFINKYLTNNIKIIFDIGCNVGTASKKCLKISSDVIVIAVDTWITSKNVNIYDDFINNLIEYKDRVIPIKMDVNKALLYLKKYDIIPDLILLNVIKFDKSINKELVNICNFYPSSKIIGNDILANKTIGLGIKELLGKTCTKYILEIDENAFTMIPKLYDYKDNNSSVKFNKIKPENISKKPLYIILFYPNTEFGRSNSVKWYNSFKKIRHKIKVENYVLILFEQNNNFYLGQMYNIGFKIINDVNANYIFHAANLIPDTKLIKYYSCEPTNPIHLDVGNENYAYNYDQLGTFMISGTDLLRINGFANNQTREQVWFLTFMRMATNNFIVDQPIEGKMKKIYDSFIFKNKSIKDLTLINEHWNTWKKNGLNDIKYGVYKYKKIKQKDYFYYIKANDRIISFNSKMYITIEKLKIDNNFKRSKILKVLPILNLIKKFQKNSQIYFDIINKYYELNTRDSNKFISQSDIIKYGSFSKDFMYSDIQNKNSNNILIIQFKFKNIDVKKTLSHYISKYNKKHFDLFLINENLEFKLIKSASKFKLYESSFEDLNLKKKYDLIEVQCLGIKYNIYELYKYKNSQIFNDMYDYSKFILNLLKNLQKNGTIKLSTWFPFNLNQLKHLSYMNSLFESSKPYFFYDFKCWFDLILVNYKNVKPISYKMININPFIERTNDLNVIFKNINEINQISHKMK